MVDYVEYMDMTCKVRITEIQDVSGISYAVELLRVECLDVDITDLLTRKHIDELNYKYGKDEDLTELELHIMDLNKDFDEIEEGAKDAYMMSIRS
jgi:hypothetical protein